jgi:hypothetical protein
MYNIINFFFLLSAFGIIMLLYYNKYNKLPEKKVYILVCTFLFIIINTRDYLNLYDQKNYMDYFDIYTYYPDTLPQYVKIESSFKLICTIVNFFFGHNVFFLFFIYSIGFIIKAKVIYTNMRNIYSTDHNNLIFGALLIYCSFYLILHDFIQIRIGFAIAMFLVAANYKLKNEIVKCIVFLLFSILFHASAIFGIIILFLSDNKLNLKLYYILLIAAFIIAILHIDLIRFIPINIELYAIKIAMYSNQKEYSINVFSVPKLVRYIILLVLMATWELNKKNNNMFVLFSKLYFFSIFFQLLLASIPVIPTRISEFFRISEVFVLPSLVNCFQNKIMINSLFVVYCVCIFAFTINEYIFF